MRAFVVGLAVALLPVTASATSRAFPYLLLGFAFESDLLAVD
ncbi:MAG: hypothetical protein JWP01_1130 [Myxococcales bacterium]|nr:hypothetical protein [Myxococcales bacterium]